MSETERRMTSDELDRLHALAEGAQTDVIKRAESPDSYDLFTDACDPETIIALTTDLRFTRAENARLRESASFVDQHTKDYVAEIEAENSQLQERVNAAESQIKMLKKWRFSPNQEATDE